MKEVLKLSSKKATFNRNVFLNVKGAVDTNLYYIESGSLKIFLLDDEKEQIIRFGYRGNLIASLDSFLTGKPSNLYIQTIKKCDVKVITKEQIDKFLLDEDNKTLWTGFLQNLALQQMEREIDLLTTSPKER